MRVSTPQDTGTPQELLTAQPGISGGGRRVWGEGSTGCAGPPSPRGTAPPWLRVWGELRAGGAGGCCCSSLGAVVVLALPGSAGPGWQHWHRAPLLWTGGSMASDCVLGGFCDSARAL